MKVYSINTYIDMLKEQGLLVDSYIHDQTKAIENITYNSKHTDEFTLFVCKGMHFKPEYLFEALKNGTPCYVSEILYETDIKSSYIIVSDVRKAMAYIASMFYDNIFNMLNLIGITGTKGKTTTAYFIKYILDEYCQNKFEKPSALLSSVSVYDGKINKLAHLTTPEAFELFSHFNNAVNSGIRFLTMEVSSQALKYDRTLGVKFNVGVFLNISLDHISPLEHTDFDDYFESKLKLFSQCDCVIINLDTDHKERVMEAAREKCSNIITFGFCKEADVYAYDIKKQDNLTYFKVKTTKFDEKFCLTMPGLFNVENALAAIAVSVLNDIPVDNIKTGLKKARISGRMEIYRSANDEIISIVDYAHNQLSFTKLFESVKQEFNGREIITVFGCPGDKALNRRSELGEIASRYSAKVYLTSDDPAYETVQDISNEVKKYIHCQCEIVEDRCKAIETAILSANKNSLVLVLGKGAENVQKVRGELVDMQADGVSVQKALEMETSLRL